MSRKSFIAWFLQLIVLSGLLVWLYVVVDDHAALLSARAAEAEAESVELQQVSEYYIAPISATPTPEPSPTETPKPAVTSETEFRPVAGATAQVEPVITRQSIMVNGETVSSYQADAAHKIDFGLPEEYTDAAGIITFRGNNFRNTAQYGLAVMTEQRFGDYWTVSTGGLNDNSGNYWGGSGWTGQPLAVEWPRSTKEIMNMYDWAIEKDGLVEVIYATLGGTVYFLDLETGEYTRDPLFLGFSFKGAGALDPRGYPLLYVGAGLFNSSGEAPRILVVSLIDGEVLYSTGQYDSFAPRSSWSAFDGSALVDAETDQLIYPGENGVIYFIKLNTDYSEREGTLSVNPTVTKFTFASSTADQYYYGMEDSAVIWRNYLMVADNGADFICLDTDTMEIVWRFDCLDDTNCTPLLELDEDGHPWIYLSTSFHYGWRSYNTAVCPVWKIDAVTGEEVWRRDYECYSESGLSGGVQGSFALGTGSLEGILYVAMARYPSAGNGQLLALDTETGEEVWSVTSPTYSWCTPTCIYDQRGRGYVIYTSSINGQMMLLDGLTGDMYDSFAFAATTEASPIVYNNTIVIGTRGQQIFGITLE